MLCYYSWKTWHMYKERQRILPSLVSTLEACQTCWALSSSHFVFSVSLYSLLARISGLKETLLLVFWFSPAIFFDLGRKIIENAAMFKNFEKGKDIFENFRVIGWSIFHRFNKPIGWTGIWTNQDRALYSLKYSQRVLPKDNKLLNLRLFTDHIQSPSPSSKTFLNPHLH